MYPTSLPPPSGARGHSVSLLALTVVLALNCPTGGESTSLYRYVRIATDTLCAVCASVCVLSGERGRVSLRLVVEVAKDQLAN